MWGFFVNSKIVSGKPYWYYQLGGSGDFLNEILCNQSGVFADKGICYYRTKRFFGPVIGFNIKETDGKKAFIPAFAKGIPEVLSKLHEVNFESVANSISYRNINTLFTKKYEMDVDYSKVSRFSKLGNVIISDIDKIISLLAAFVNFNSQAVFVKIYIKSDDSRFDFRLSEILDFVLAAKIPNHSKGFKFFVGSLTEVLKNSPFLSAKPLNNYLHPLNNKELLYSQWGVSSYTSSVNKLNLCIEKIEVPACLYFYAIREVKVYAIKEAVSYYDWIDEQKCDRQDESDYQDWIRDGLDDMYQADPDWHWNVD